MSRLPSNTMFQGVMFIPSRKLRAERRMGEMLKEMPRPTGKFVKGVKGLQDVTPNKPTLSDIGLQKHQSFK